MKLQEGADLGVVDAAELAAQPGGAQVRHQGITFQRAEQGLDLRPAPRLRLRQRAAEDFALVLEGRRARRRRREQQGQGHSTGRCAA
jgi:hypothetical protein